MTISERSDRLTVHGRFAEQARLTQERIAVVCGNRHYTYQELDRSANRIAYLLTAAGIGRDQTVGLLTDRSVDMIPAMLGIMKAGAAYLPMDPRAPAKRIRFMLSDSGSSVVLALTKYSDLLKGYTGKVIAIDELSGDEDFQPAAVAASQPEDLCYIIYTSGTTGKPKGVMVEHRNVINLMNGLQSLIYQEYAAIAPLKIALVAPYYFDASVQQIFATLLFGHTLYIVPEETRVSGKELLRYYEYHGIEISDGTPAHLKMMTYAMNGFQGEPFGVRHLIIGGEELTWSAVADFCRLFSDRPPRITNIYGPTECCVDSLAYSIDADDIPDSGSVPIGRPLDGQAAYVLNPNLEFAADGETGELYISGGGVGRGYLGLPELTSQSFLQDPFVRGALMYRTGDLAKRLPEGNLAFHGRIDHQVKIRGFRIEPGEIRSRILLQSYVKDAEVVSFQNDHEETELCAYFVADRPLDVSDIKAGLAGALPDYMVPAAFVQMDSMPLTPNGKLDRKALPKPVKPSKTASVPTEFLSLTERRLLSILQDVLGSQELGIDDSFFEWGGHSLKANLLVSRIESVFGVEVALLDVFNYPSLRELAACVERAEASSSPPLVPAEERDHYPLSAAQRWMYILARIDGGRTTWNMPGAFRIEGPLDKGRFQNAAQLIVERHDIFRTRFEWMNDGPVQRVDRNAGIRLPVHHSTEAGLEPLISSLVRPFELARPPLIRLEWIELSETSRVLFFDAHHLVFDGGSIGPFLRELADAYMGKDLPPPALQYKDFAVWERLRLNGDRLAKLEQYWTHVFEGDLPRLNLPTDYDRPARLSGRGGVVSLLLDEALTERIRQLSTEAGVSVYMVLLSSFYVLLSKYTGQADIVVGTLSAGRSAAALEKIPGMFVQTLALRNYPDGNKTFLSLVNEVKERTLQAFAHEDYPLDLFEAKVASVKTGKRRPLFDVMFNYLNFDDQELSIPGLSISSYPIDAGLSRYDLVVESKPVNKELHFQWSYSTDLFKPETVRSMTEHYLALLAQLTANADAALKHISWHVDVDLESGQDLPDSIDFDF